jgi:hypothetical protein
MGVRCKPESKAKDIGLLNGVESMEPYKEELMEVFMYRK